MTNMFKPSEPPMLAAMTPAPAPTPAPAMPAPDPSAPAYIEANKRRLQRSLARGGRTSTILTGKDGAPGSDRFAEYSDSRLGASN